MTDKTKMRIDIAELTFREMYELNQLLGVPFADALQGLEQPKAMAAAVWILERRHNPAFTFDEAFDLSMQRDLELVAPDTDSGKAGAGINGDMPPALPASGG